MWNAHKLRSELYGRWICRMGSGICICGHAFIEVPDLHVKRIGGCASPMHTLHSLAHTWTVCLMRALILWCKDDCNKDKRIQHSLWHWQAAAFAIFHLNLTMIVHKRYCCDARYSSAQQTHSAAPLSAPQTKNNESICTFTGSSVYRWFEK